MNEKLRPYAIPLLIIAAQFALGLFFILTNRLPDPNVVTEWPSGASSRTLPFWGAAIFMPVMNLFFLAAMAVEVHSSWPKIWRAEDWRRRPGIGSGTTVFLLVGLMLEYVGLLNLSSQWTLNQGHIQAVAGAAMGILTVALGNYQTKTSTVGLWSFTPWRLSTQAARQKCQRIAGRILMLGGGLIILLNAILANSEPVLHLGGLPTYPQILVTEGGFFLLLAIIAIATWKPSREKVSVPESTTGKA